MNYALNWHLKYFGSMKCINCWLNTKLNVRNHKLQKKDFRYFNKRLTVFRSLGKHSGRCGFADITLTACCFHEKFWTLSGHCWLSDISITARRYRTLNEQSLIFLFISFLNLYSPSPKPQLQLYFSLKSIIFLVIFHQIEALKTILIIFRPFLTN